MTIKRAYSLLQIKSFSDSADGEERIIEGIATTPTADRMGDIVEPLGARFALPMPLLWQHDHNMPVGLVEFATPTATGIPFVARLPKITEAGKLKDRVDEAWQSVKAGLVRAVSIGFNASDYEVMPTGGIRFKEWEWLELSLVTVPANAEATLSTIKSIDRKSLAALGTRGTTITPLDTPAAGATAATTIQKAVSPTNPNRSLKMKTIAEQLAALRANRAEKAARMADLMQKSAEAGETLNAAEAEEFDLLEGDLADMDAQVKRIETLERVNVSTAKAVDGKSPAAASASRQGVTLKEKSEPGIEFARYVGVLAAAKGNTMHAYEIAKNRFPNQEKLHSVIKAAVAAGTTTDPTWAGNLVEYQTLSNDFIEFLRPQTIIGKIPGLRKVPFNVRIRSQIAGASASWVGEGSPKPVTKAGYDNVILGHAKVAAIAVLTQELLRFSSPSAEALIRDELARAIISRIDADFIDPLKALVAGVSPASITNGVTPIVSSDNVSTDVSALFSAFIVANQDPSTAVWIMNGVTALAISQKKNALGQKEYPEMNMLGGTLEGLPVVVSQYVPSDSTGHLLILANASDILLADDGNVVIDASQEATLAMDSAPGSTATHNLWQHNEVAFRAERFINWGKARPTAVVYVSGANY